ncbi:TetR/AcrR family transcriptional regulator [Chelativorans sp. Marseille-P2723]|uniref:TetR/AcrR family transcriptional regulator n=1 Tax=Chelativorans sp. Marseille-P2723 TaxID=2709133 RepID=UPI00156D809E|nr:TetR/AcrR family transcriptional regulator [Chelativorans sp. Marseille-P2723]
MDRPRAKRETRRKTAAPPKRWNAVDRKKHIILEAARLFAMKGFDATSMREVAGRTGVLAGSLYYYFESKEQLFLEVHTEGMKVLSKNVDEAIKELSDPWDKLEAAAIAHCRALVEEREMLMLVVPTLPVTLAPYREELVRQRDEYEKKFAQIIAECDLPDRINRDVLRLHLLGALNWTQVWYRPGTKLSIDEVARQIVRSLQPCANETTALPEASGKTAGKTH